MTPEEAHILIVDDHAIVRHGLRHLIEDIVQCGQCYEASNAREALDILEEEKPDLALLDMSMNGLSGLEMIKQFTSSYPDVSFLVLTMLDKALYGDRALQAGAVGFISKEAPDEQLIDAIQTVLSGDKYVGESIRSRGKEGSESATKADFLDELSDRELEVFTQLGEGFAPRHIAANLHISVKTVETHRRNIRRKLDLDTAHELSRFAIKWNKKT